MNTDCTTHPVGTFGEVRCTLGFGQDFVLGEGRIARGLMRETMVKFLAADYADFRRFCRGHNCSVSNSSIPGIFFSLNLKT